MIRGLARMLAVAALFPLALPAQAVADQSFTTSGSITYTWQGDPARGCAAEGLCGVQGALIVESQGGASSTSGFPAGQRVDVPVDTSGATVRVADGPGGGECVDTAGIPGGGDLLIKRRRGRLVGIIESSLSSGRCAGPTQQDLAGLVLPVRRSGGKHPTFDLHAMRSFAVGPFTGQMVSTLMVKSLPAAGSGTVTSSSGPSGPPRLHKVLMEQVTLHYRIASVPSALDAAFSGVSDPFCAAFDSCGATGTLSLSIPGLEGSFMVQATRQVNRRVDARRVLADFRRGRLRAGGGLVSPSGGSEAAQVTETFSGSRGLRCQDTVQTARQAQLLVGPPPPAPGGGGGGTTMLLNDSIGSGLLRTHCPGPSDIDVLGNFPGAAKASIGLRQLLERHSVISLSAPDGFSGLGYAGTRSGALEFSLTLERVQARTIEVTRL